MTAEPVGANCAAGGQKIEAGADSNGNGALDAAEVASTAYVCNGISGEPGASGPSGASSLIDVVPEPPGSNCANGGVQVHAGVDANGNRVLDVEEVTSVAYVCNGADGKPADAGMGGANGSSPDGGEGGVVTGPIEATIQLIQDGTIGVGRAVSLRRVFVTALRGAPPQTVELVIQASPEEPSNGHAYPDYAGMFVLLTGDQSAGIEPPKVGDCIDIVGVVGDVQGRAQLADITFSVASGCGPLPAPTLVPLVEIATDIVPALDGAQPGPRAEALEGVLVSLTDQDVSVVATGAFGQISIGNLAVVLIVDDFLAPGVTAGIHGGEVLHGLTGVLAQGFAGYVLYPRTLSDLF